MKVLCPLCDRLGELNQFRFEQGALRVTCVKCGVETLIHAAVASAPESVNSPVPSAPRLSSSPGASNVVHLKSPSTEAVEQAAAAAQQELFSVPDGLCPKCLVRRLDGAAACGQCGLVFELFDPQALEPPEWLVTEWKALLRSWGDEAVHDQLRKQAMQVEALAAVGRLYRLRLASMPDDPFALRGREEVVRLASVPVSTRGSAENKRGSTLKLFLVVGIFALTLIGAVILLGVMLQSRGAL